MVTKTTRREMVDRWRELAEQIRNGIYFVKRGAINWTTFPFVDRTGGIALMIDDGTLFRNTMGMKDARCSMEMFRAMPEDEEEPQVDDGLMDELLDDAETILLDLLKSTDSNGDPILFKIDRDTVRFVEAHDTSIKVQGIVVTFNLTY